MRKGPGRASVLALFIECDGLFQHPAVTLVAPTKELVISKPALKDHAKKIQESVQAVDWDWMCAFLGLAW